MRPSCRTCSSACRTRRPASSCWRASRPWAETTIQDLRRAFTDGWIDVYENAGKTSGAYSWGVYGVHPYVLLNYEPTLDSLFTIAHELGHSMHTFYSDKNQAFLNSEYPLFLAEIASTTNEAILLSSLKEKFTRRDQRMALCNYQLEQIRGTVYRQTLFAEFEREVHAMAMRGEAPDRRGADGRLPPAQRGLLQGRGRGRRHRHRVDAHPALLPRVLRLPVCDRVFRGRWPSRAACSRATRTSATSTSGSWPAAAPKPPLETLRLAGVDMESPEPVEECLRSFEEALDEMERLMEEA